ncbi:39S ribosomal protein L48, mitochondrial isoform X1 [Athene cunicularia]|uniref:39S ribosomal protein L48, mitochondrial isoform X1 n=1 Tax=Athene cunicularia TaxID=194338 RepID=UPI000EF6DFA3|nr:39S ribosomal protein L48, mitochondrial isoform X1 [Athene cunicularia]
MSAALPKVLCLKKGALLKQVFALSRAATPRESCLCAAGGALVSCHRHYRARPTHGIGRFKHLLPKEIPKKKKDKVQMKEINVGTEYEYGDVNIYMTSYDMCLVEHFAQYVHKLCNRLSVKVNESTDLWFLQLRVAYQNQRSAVLGRARFQTAAGCHPYYPSEGCPDQRFEFNICSDTPGNYSE